MDKPAHRPLSHFVLRTPTLPFAAIASWGEDRRAHLNVLIDDPAVREALYVASPDLDTQIAAWQREPETAASVAVERALVRYVTRMAARSTPFGLFSSVAVGTTGGATNLDIAPRAAARRHTRLDNDVLFALCARLGKDADARPQLRYFPNSSLYIAAERLRYAEARLAGATRAYHLVAVDRSDYLDALLARAEIGASHDDLIAVLCSDPEITRDDAAAFVDELVDAQLIVSDLQPAVTGREPTIGIASALDACGLDRHAAPLHRALDALAAIDASAPGVPPAAYQAIERDLAASLPIEIEASRLFQVDMFKDGDRASLGDSVVTELARGIELLRQLAPAADDPWTRFRQRFVARYETREVPLLEVLDGDVGIGLDAAESPRSAPLLADLAFPTRFEPRRVAVAARDVRLTQLVTDALRSGATEIELSDDDVAALSRQSAPPLHPAIAVHAVVVAESAAAVCDGRYQLRINHVGAAANLLGRFCHGSPEVTELTARALRAEEAQRPDAIFAEVVHLPEGRVGNVLLRPVLRDYEIPFLGASGADRDHQIAVSDLLVSVEGDRIVLRSKRLDKEILPRNTTAHNFMGGSLAVYRFLCSIANQGIGDAYWSWGVMADLPFLPRVRRGRFILARARWLLGKRDLAPFESAFEGSKAAKTPDQIRAIRARAAAAMQALRTRLALPRWVVLADGDNELPIDLDNELMVDSAAHLLKGRTSASLFELCPGPDQLCARGVEGAFAHEVIALYAQPEPAAVRASQTRLAAPVQRRFLPGSSWLSLKLYTGTATADTLLRELVAPVIANVRSSGLATKWFFIRYGDPDWHIRLRFAGEPRALAGELLPCLHDALASAAERGLMWRLVVDTYEREVERYGGSEGIVLAEQLFCADSEAALAIVQSCRGDAGADAAWRLALLGVDRLLDDLGLSLADKLAHAQRTRDGFGAEIGMDTAFQRALGEKYRKHAKELAALLAAPEQIFAPAASAFAQRSATVRAIAERLRELEAAGRLGTPVEQLVGSYVHMHVNRMTRSSQRLHELVLHDLLRRHYDGLVARSRKKAG